MPRGYPNKTAAKKPAVKRVVKRKPKVVEHDVNLEALLTSGLELQEQAEESNASKFARTDIIDMRGLPACGRFHVAFLLESLGFVFAHNLSAKPTDLYHDYMTVDAIKLQHTNKIATLTNARAVSESAAVSSLESYEVQSIVNISDPMPMVPDQVFVNGVVYNRNK